MKTDLPAESYVQPIDLVSLAARFETLPKRDKALIRLYLKGAKRYVLTLQDGVFPNLGTEHWRNIAERGHGAAVLAAVATEWPADLRERCQRESVAFVRDFVDGYRKDNFMGNKRKESDDHAWQASWWVGEMGVAAWFLWDQLDPDLKKGVADMVVFHADQIADRKPGARVVNDTEAETVAWNSTILTLAVNMMPTHPKNAKWGEAAKQYLYSIFATSKDMQDSTPGDDGKPIKDWVVGANIHDDYSLENHGRFHIDYVFACYRFMIQGAALYRLGGNQVPAACTHHTKEVYENILLECMNGSKFAIYVSDNDWKRYHIWTESPAVHGFIALTAPSPLASTLEEESLRNAEALWEDFPKGFTYDNLYVCGKAWTPRIADIVLLHLLSSPLPEPMPAAKVEAQLRGAHQKQDVNLMTHYSKEGSFRSIYWGPGPTVRQIEPKDNGWMILPLATNYSLAVDGQFATDAGTQTLTRKGDDWFWTSRNPARGEHEAFISLPDEIIVMMNAVPSTAIKDAKRIDSVVTIEKPHKKFTIYSQNGKATFHSGDDKWDRTDKSEGLELDTNWVNLADSMGYVVVDLSQNAPRMILPKPGVRDSLNLHHVENPAQDQLFVSIAFPNQDHALTKAMSGKINCSYSEGVMTCLVPPYFVWANFSERVASPKIPEEVRFAGTLSSPPNSVGILRLEKENKLWGPLD